MKTPGCPVKSLSLDDAISHADEVAGDCSTSCKREHKQLADWLRELKSRRSAERGNAAKMREALKAIDSLCDRLMPTWDGAVGRIKDIADAALAAPATSEKSSAVGNAAKLREALEALLDLAYEVEDMNSDSGPRTSMPTKFVIDTAKSALSAPPRNCDRFASAEEAWDAYDEWVDSYRAQGKTEPFNEFGWLFAPATEKKGGGE